MPIARVDTVAFCEAAESWLPVLIDASIKGLAVLGLAAVATRMMRRSSAATRHLVWFAALTSLPLLPVLSATLPDWHVLPGWAALPAPAATQEYSTPGRTPSNSPAPAPGPNSSAPLESYPVVPPVEPAATQDVATSRTALSWQAWLAVAWLVGMAAALAPIGVGLLSLWRLRRRAEPISEGPWPDRIQRLAADMGISRRIVLLRSDRRAMPMQWGIVRPKLLLPAEAQQWSDQRQQVVILHELAHVKRSDCLTQLTAQLAAAIFWFNPLVWVVLRRLRLEREAACDDMIIAAGCSPEDYADQLLAIASGLEAHVLAAYTAIAMARPSALEGRLLAILDNRRNRRTLSGAAVTVAICTVFAVVTPLAMLRAVTVTSNPLPLPSAIQPVAAQRPAVEILRRLGADVQINRNGHVTLVHLERRQITDDDLACLAELPNLARLYLADTRTTDAGLKYIRGLSQLRRLSLHGTPLTDAGLAQLAGLSTLEVLDLHHTRVTDAGMVHLGRLGNLTYLNLGCNPGVTDVGLARLKGLSRLAELDLTQTSISDAGLAYLREMPALASVKLAGTRITSGWLGHLLGSNVQRLDEPVPGNHVSLLRQLPNLRYVKLRDATDADLAHLGSLPRLERLDLAETDVTDAGLIYLKKLPNLRSLILRSTGVTDAGLSQVAQLPRLQSLDVANTAVGNAGLQRLRGHTGLQWVIATGTSVTRRNTLPGVRIDLTE
ncbi:MAG: hypothetical protein HQ567_08425 [Candidatus Nealsonbacteria bacterium]|nr:hypothetical protein [Candidatus Nealsonbacteria bacterium]